MTDQLISNLIVAAWLAPAAGFAIVIVLFSRMGNDQNKQNTAAWFTVAVMGFSLLCSIIAFVGYGARDPIVETWNWLPIGVGEYAPIGPMVDRLTVTLFVMVSLISLLVHLYSVGYMTGDPKKRRFMAYMQLFTFSMLGIVSANSLLHLFIFWEMVGLTSYLLIGFWYEKRAPQLACKKAFFMNRIGDAGFMLGFGILFFQCGGNILLPINAAANGGDSMLGALLAQGIDPLNPGANNWWLTLAGIGLFCGAMGKSAQFPLHTWLPDAMEGPTPVSSIVHSATMVAAGVYMTARIFPLLTPAALLFVATIGLVTLITAALIACVQTDIKRVLAYSTLSQLGYMVLGLGCGSYTFALFHLITHAFFKCSLFQCAGSVITVCHHEKELPQYGGLLKKMPWTATAFILSTLAIAGAAIPIVKFGDFSVAFGGFFSKDGIIAGAYTYSSVIGDAGFGKLYVWAPVCIAYVTAFYMTRAFVLTFLGKPRNQAIHDHAHETPWTMVVPQLVLALIAMIAGYIGIDKLILETAPQTALAAGAVTGHELHENMHTGYHFVHGWVLLFGGAWIVSMIIGLLIYRNGFTITDRIVRIPVIKQVHWLIYNKFGFDGLFDIVVILLGKLVAIIIGSFDKYIIDGLVNLAGWAGKQMAFAVGIFDDQVIDGSVRGIAEAAKGTGGMLSTTHSGNLRRYIMMMAGLSIVGLFVILASVGLIFASA
ncbi:MAG: NADH-quinone oxidoreductase subunit L [Phycisphaerales bacterium]|nr:NADH-quinone oxidoreductase subunit L [Phycisphaerales bacterium]